MADDASALQGFEAGGISSWALAHTDFYGPGFRFGVFDLDTKTGELRKEGRIVRLRNQPFLVLSALLGRAGDLVTREEIKAALWADNVDVDVEQGLNYCVKEIRAALGDSADAPRFIQTLPRRGYRFLADVRQVGLEPARTLPMAGAHAAHEGLPSNGFNGATTEKELPVAPAQGRTRQGRRLLVAGVTLAMAAALTLSWFIAGSGRAGSPMAPGDPVPRLVVLPFTDLSLSPEDYLAAELTDELIGSLGHQTDGRLGVIARTSSFAYRNRSQDASAFARSLGAAYFLEGTLRREDRTVRVNVSLARAEDGARVWSASYDRSVLDLQALQREVVSAIGAVIRVAVDAEIVHPGAMDPVPYLDYLRGRFEWNRRTEQSLLESKRIFESITERHPEFARGWVGLADAYAVLMDQGYLSGRDVWRQAKAADEKAVSLDPNLPEAWTNLGLIRGLYEWNVEGAEEAFERAAALEPNSATRLLWQSILFRSEGRYAEALDNLKKARELDPLSPPVRLNVAGVLSELGREQEALAEAESVVSMAPAWGPGLLLLGQILERAERMDEAEAAYAKAGASGSIPALAEIAAFHARKGQPGLAREALRKLQQQSARSYVSPYLIAAASAGVDREAAFRALQASFAERSPALRLLRKDPRLAALRGDPRFDRLVRVLWPPPSPAP